MSIGAVYRKKWEPIRLLSCYGLHAEDKLIGLLLRTVLSSSKVYCPNSYFYTQMSMLNSAFLGVFLYFLLMLVIIRLNAT